MSHSQSENQKKRRVPLLGVLIAVLVLGLTVGGVSAYLSMSSNAAESTFANAGYPEVSVSGTSVTVAPNGYSVYLRVAVDADLIENGKVMPGEPTVTFDTGNNWIKNGGFYYYKTPISSAATLTVPVSSSGTIKIAAQVIQAVGQTDGDDPVDAVKDAWGLNPQT